MTTKNTGQAEENGKQPWKSRVAGDDLADRVAEAMHTAGHKAGFFTFPWEKVAAHGREKYRVLAGAAIAAIQQAKGSAHD